MCIQTKIYKKRNTGDSEIHLADTYFNIGLIYFEKKPNKKIALNNFKQAYDRYIKYPQSAHAQKWAKEAKNKIDDLNAL